MFATGKHHQAKLAIAILGAGLVATAPAALIFKSRMVAGGWVGGWPVTAKSKSYGPPVKGRGGKVKRW